MRTVVVFCLLALAVAGGVRAFDDEGHDADAGADAAAAEETETVEVEKVQGHKGSAVVELGSSSVDTEGVHDWADVVGRDLPVLVEFYLPSCGHCQGFASEYERVAKAFHSTPVVVARIDANRWTSIADHYHVKSVPDIRYFAPGTRVDQPYISARVATDLVDFVNHYAGTKVVFDYSFRQQHGTAGAAESAAVVVDEGTCPVVHTAAAALVEAEADAVTAEDVEAAEEEAAAAEDALEDADEEVDAQEEEADVDVEDEDAALEAESEADAADIEADIADEAELEGAAEAEAEADEAEADA